MKIPFILSFIDITITCEPGSIDIVGALILGAGTQENSVAVRWQQVSASVFALQT